MVSDIHDIRAKMSYKIRSELHFPLSHPLEGNRTCRIQCDGLTLKRRILNHLRKYSKTNSDFMIKYKQHQLSNRIS